jgi:hypothetical protein
MAKRLGISNDDTETKDRLGLNQKGFSVSGYRHDGIGHRGVRDDDIRLIAGPFTAGERPSIGPSILDGIS